MRTWTKPRARTRVETTGWAWASVKVIAFRKGRTIDDYKVCRRLDHIEAEPVKVGRRAQLPQEVADWMVQPFAVHGGRFLDPFAGSGALVRSAEEFGMQAIGYERQKT